MTKSRVKINRVSKGQSRALFDIVESPESKGDRKIVEIIEATIECLSSLGIEQTSFEAVGRKAGIIKAHVNYYFKEKDDLIRGVLEYVLAKAQKMTVSALQKQKNPKLLLKTLNDVTFEWAEANHSHISVIVLLYYQCTVQSKLKNTHTQARIVARQRLVEILKAMGIRGNNKKLEMMALTLHALLSGYLLEYATTRLSVPLEQQKQDCYRNMLSIVKQA